MSFRFTITTMLLLTALIAVGAAAGRAGGPNGVVSFVMAVAGLCVLIGSDWSETVRERIVLIFVGLGLLAWAALWLLPNTR